MASFEQALLDQLKEYRSPARRRTHRTAVTVTAAALVFAAGIPVVLARTASPAYAVERAPDGTVTFTMTELRDYEGATAALRDAGVRAVVLPVRSPADCPDGQPEASKAPASLLEWDSATSNSVRIHPSAMPRDSVLGVTGFSVQEQPVVKVLLYPAPGPTCIAIPDKVQ